MIPDALALFGTRSFPLTWAVFGILVGVVPLIVILAGLASVVKGRRRRGNGLGVACLILMLGAMAFLLMPARSRRHVRIDLPPASLLPPVELEVPLPALTPTVAIADGMVQYSEAAVDGRGEFTVAIDHGHGTARVAAVTERRLPGPLHRFTPKVVWSAITACAIAALMFVGYIALDAGTRGQFTWPLRVLSLLCFGAIITTVVALRHAL